MRNDCAVFDYWRAWYEHQASRVRFDQGESNAANVLLIEDDTQIVARFKPAVSGNLNFTCVFAFGAGCVDLTWTNQDAYETIEVLRNGDVIAQLPGTTERWRDCDLPDTPSLRYTLRPLCNDAVVFISEPCTSTTLMTTPDTVPPWKRS